MNYYPFDSRNPLYKSSIGAVKADTDIKFRLLIHFDAKVHDAYLIIKPDNENEYEIKLNKREDLEYYSFYDTTVKLNEGLYWYKFRYTSDYGEFFVTKTDTSLGIVSRDGGYWQQTVYSADFSTPTYLNGGIIYQIFPDRFYNSKMPKRNVPNDRFICDTWEKQPEYKQNNGICSLGNDYYGGDLQGVIEKIPYLKDLGVTVIYLNPIFEAHSNHRYNTADYLKVDSLLGDEEDLKRLCKIAKENGISVILDGVFSHTGDDSIYFNKYNRYGEDGAFNSFNSKYHKWYSFGNFDCGYSAWWGVPSLPQVNEEEPTYLDFITGKDGVIDKWMKLGVSGFRLDVADELPDVFLENLRTAVKRNKKDGYVLGEVWEDASNKISYGKRRKFLIGHQLDSVMNYPFSNAIFDYVCTANSKNINNTVLSILENYPKESVNCLMNHIGTHDTMRAITRIAKYNNPCYDRQWQSQQYLSNDEYKFAVMRLKIAVTLQYTLPGLPSLYYGDEAGLTGYGDPFCRGTYPWGKEDLDLISFYKAIGKLRLSLDSLKSGDYIPLCDENGFLVYLRKSKKETVLVALNPTEEYKEFYFGDISSFNCVFGENISDKEDAVKLKPYGYAILK